MKFGPSRAVGRYGRLDRLLLDELGYVQVDPRGAELPDLAARWLAADAPH